MNEEQRATLTERLEHLKEILDEACAAAVQLESSAEELDDQSLWRLSQEVWSKVNRERLRVSETTSRLLTPPMIPQRPMRATPEPTAPCSGDDLTQ